MKKILLITLLLQQVYASQSMKLLYVKNACNSCHGMYGEGMGASPRLTGVKASILYKRLKNLQAGKPRSAFGTIMVSFAQMLNERETKEMAEYLSTLKRTSNEERYDIEYDPAGDGGS